MIEPLIIDDLLKPPQQRQMDQKSTDGDLESGRESPGRDVIYLECDICYDEAPESDFSHLCCGHHFMTECIRQFWLTQVQHNKTQSIKCAEASCCYKPTRSEIENILGPEGFSQFLRIEENLQVAQSGGRLKQCPYPDCEGVYDLGAGLSLLGSKQLTCTTCTRGFCKECGQQWHQGNTCEDAARLNGFDWDLVGDSSGLANRCPKCKSPFEKSSGCQHMTCAVCKYEWCWLCGMPYNSIIHYAQLGGLMCELLAFTKFKKRPNCCCQLLIYLLIFLLLPLIGLIVCLLGATLPIIVVHDGSNWFIRLWRRIWKIKFRPCLVLFEWFAKAALAIAFIVIYILTMVILLALGLAFASVTYGLCILPCMVLYLVIVVKTQLVWRGRPSPQVVSSDEVALLPETTQDSVSLLEEPAVMADI